MDNLDVKEYSQRKGALMRHALNRLGRPPFCMHLTRNPFYQTSHACPMKTGKLWQLIRRHHLRHHPQRPSRKPSVVRLAIEWGNARRILGISRHQRTNTVRGIFYKRKCGVPPDVIVEQGATAADDAMRRMGRRACIGSTFRRRLEELRSRGSRHRSSAATESSLQTRANCRLLMGDIVFCVAGEIEGVTANVEEGRTTEAMEVEAGNDTTGADHHENDHENAGEAEQMHETPITGLWWTVQVTKALERIKVGKRCKVFGFWIDLMSNGCGRLNSIQRKRSSSCRVACFVIAQPTSRSLLTIVDVTDLPSTWGPHPENDLYVPSVALLAAGRGG